MHYGGNTRETRSGHSFQQSSPRVRVHYVWTLTSKESIEVTYQFGIVSSAALQFE
jgi:hypothetical protein